jgi:LmbE family N-acetylglucosaminyl deacetylase
MALLHGTCGIQTALRGLSMAGCVLHVGAHPDDEDVGLIAYVARKHGARAVYWSATRGEGGQNHIGPYSGLALGVYRTWESEAARVGDGGECLFGPFFDFGFSKTGDEALGRWGIEATVREIVRAIRMVQPDVIVSRWQGNADDFHGQHQAVGKAAKEAFVAAADPTRYPELELPAWQALKYYESLDNSGGDQSAGGACNLLGRANPNFEQDGCLRLNTGEFDPAAGLTYQQQAWIAYNRHQTQAMGVAPNAGDFFYYFRRHASLVPTLARETDFYEGFDPTLRGLSRLAAAESQTELASRLSSLVVALEAAELAFRPAEPRTAVLPLLNALDRLRELAAVLGRFAFDGEGCLALVRYLSRKEDDVQRLVAHCAGVEAECTVPKAKLIPGETMRSAARLWNRADDLVELVDFGFIIPPGWRVRPVGDSTTGPACEFHIDVAPAADISCPYWLMRPRIGDTYVWDDRKAAGLPFAKPPARLVQYQSHGPAVGARGTSRATPGFPGRIPRVAAIGGPAHPAVSQDPQGIPAGGGRGPGPRGAGSGALRRPWRHQRRPCARRSGRLARRSRNRSSQLCPGR